MSGSKNQKILKEIKEKIAWHKREIQKLYDEADKVWVKPDCNKCIHRDSPCVPEPFDCSGFVEE